MGTRICSLHQSTISQHPLQIQQHTITPLPPIDFLVSKFLLNHPLRVKNVHANFHDPALSESVLNDQFKLIVFYVLSQRCSCSCSDQFHTSQHLWWPGFGGKLAKCSV